MKNYLEYLESELKKSVEAFEKAKKQAAEDILNMNHFTAQDFGAAYASHIDKVTAAAAKIKATTEALEAYKFYNEK